MKSIARVLLCASLALVMLSPGFATMKENAAADVGVVPVSSGSSVTIWEQSGPINSYTFSLATITSPNEGFFSTWGHEDYYISTDGTYLTIKCDRWGDWYPDPHPWMSVGNNIVAVSLDGVPGFPNGIWAGTVVDFQLGEYGTAESVYNALGPVDQLGPFENAQPTWLGDSWSQMTLGFLSELPQPPTASFTIWPSTDLGIYQYILFDASSSTGATDTSPLVYRWDFDGDGVWDTAFSTEPTALYWYTEEGLYSARLEVRDVYTQTNIAQIDIEIQPLQHLVGILIDKTPGYPAGPIWLGMGPRHTGEISMTIWYHYVTSVVLELYDITMDSTKIMRMTVKLKQTGVYPGGTLVLDPITLVADHYYQLFIKDLNAPVGARLIVLPGDLTW